MLTVNKKFINDIQSVCTLFKNNIPKEMEGTAIFDVNCSLDVIKEYLPNVLISIVKQYILNEEKLIFKYYVEYFCSVHRSFQLRLVPINKIKNNYGILYFCIYFTHEMLLQNIIDLSISIKKTDEKPLDIVPDLNVLVACYQDIAHYKIFKIILFKCVYMD